jgi:hypothetical protein
LVDAGTLSNLPGGLKSRGLRIKGDDTPIAPGEFRDVDVPSGTVRDNIMTLPYKEPSQVLAALLERITQEGRRLGAISDMNISDMSAQAPVGTTLALLERTLKPMAAVQARVHFAMKQEFKLLKEIIAEYADEPYDYIPEGVDRRARSEDYAMVEVIPVSDPNASTMAQRVVQYQAAFQLAQAAPQLYNLPYLHRQMIETLGLKNADKLIPTDEDQKPRDPVSENMGALMGKPMKAFIYQDHQAHLTTHQAFMQDPMIMQGIGQNPMAQQIMGSLQAHIAEHMKKGWVRRCPGPMKRCLKRWKFSYLDCWPMLANSLRKFISSRLLNNKLNSRLRIRSSNCNNKSWRLSKRMSSVRRQKIKQTLRLPITGCNSKRFGLPAKQPGDNCG